MRELSFREVQLTELEILCFFDKLCEKNNLKYYLTGGTLLGAIRHKGFIPWDDDIDICMPRKDYEQLLTLSLNSDRYILQNYIFGNLKRAITKIVDVKTHTSGLLEEDIHLWIDIFPIDGLPDEKDKVKAIYRKTYLYRKLLYVCGAKLGLGRNIVKKHVLYFLKPIVNTFLGIDKIIENFNKLSAIYSYEKFNYVGCIVGGIHGLGERMPKSEFEKAIKVEFENYRFPTFSCWESYLNNCYGDYMKLPPVEERKSHIREVLIDI